MKAKCGFLLPSHASQATDETGKRIWFCKCREFVTSDVSALERHILFTTFNPLLHSFSLILSAIILSVGVWWTALGSLVPSGFSTTNSLFHLLISLFFFLILRHWVWQQHAKLTAANLHPQLKVVSEVRERRHLKELEKRKKISHNSAEIMHEFRKDVRIPSFPPNKTFSSSSHRRRSRFRSMTPHPTPRSPVSKS